MATATGLSSYGYATVLLVHFSICATGKCESALPLGKKVPRHFPTPSSERHKSGFLNNQESTAHSPSHFIDVDQRVIGLLGHI